MLHHYLRDDTSGEHWAVGTSQYNTVLLQVQEGSTQARIQMTPDQAEACAVALMEAARKVRANSTLSGLFTEEIMEELLVEQNATEKEREMVRAAVQKSGNPWDAEVLLFIFREASKGLTPPAV